MVDLGRRLQRKVLVVVQWGRHNSRRSLLRARRGRRHSLQRARRRVRMRHRPGVFVVIISSVPPRPTAQRGLDHAHAQGGARLGHDGAAGAPQTALRRVGAWARGRGQRDARAGARARRRAGRDGRVGGGVGGAQGGRPERARDPRDAPVQTSVAFRLQRRLWVSRVSTGAVAAGSTHEGTPAAVVAQERVVVIVRDRSRHRDLLPLFVGDGWPRGKLRSLRGLLAREQRDLPRPALARSRARTQLDGLWKRHGRPFFA
ncbi:unnamed protein product [Mycena citricolor]|uniref:Uncharacterized protein n=1 Tax=Mycena citricolor TaxID=2018698 RepID=A0AAD2HQH1_9AGAR|nr:unnamed protein product [Mycena citricolor]